MNQGSYFVKHVTLFTSLPVWWGFSTFDKTMRVFQMRFPFTIQSPELYTWLHFCILQCDIRIFWMTHMQIWLSYLNLAKMSVQLFTVLNVQLVMIWLCIYQTMAFPVLVTSLHPSFPSLPGLYSWRVPFRSNFLSFGALQHIMQGWTLNCGVLFWMIGFLLRNKLSSPLLLSGKIVFQIWHVGPFFPVT